MNNLPLNAENDPKAPYNEVSSDIHVKGTFDFVFSVDHNPLDTEDDFEIYAAALLHKIFKDKSIKTVELDLEKVELNE